MMKYIKNILSVLVVLLIGYFVYKNVDLEELKKINLETIIYLFLLYVAFFTIVTIPLKYILRSLNYNIPISKIFAVTIISNLFNLALPARGGTIYRGVYFKKYFNLSLTEYFSISYLLSLGGLFTVGLYSVILLLLGQNLVTNIKIGLLTSGIIFCLFPFLGLFFPKVLLKLSQKFKKNIDEKVDWSKVRSSRNVIMTLCGYFCSMTVYWVRIHIICSIFFKEISIEATLALTCLNLAINIIPILPGNLGIKEASFAGILSMMGLSYELGLLVALIDRGMQIITLGLFSSFFFVLEKEYLLLTKILSSNNSGETPEEILENLTDK